MGIAVAAALVLAVFAAPQAAAHDVLVSSDPEDGAEVTDLTSFTLTFNNDPLDVNPVISISGPDGQEQALDVTPVVDGRDVYAEFSALAPGKYEVSWRVVSSDGHPIEGDQSFTVLPDPDAEDPADDEPAEDPDAPVSSDDEDSNDAAGAEGNDQGESDSDSPAADGTEGESEAETTAADLDDAADDSAGSWTWIWLGLAIAAVLIGLFVGRVMRKKARDTNDQSHAESK